MYFKVLITSLSYFIISETFHDIVIIYQPI